MKAYIQECKACPFLLKSGMIRPPVAWHVMIVFWGIALGTAKEPPTWPILVPSTSTDPLAGTLPLQLEGDLVHRLVEKNDQFLDAEIQRVSTERKERWLREAASKESFAISLTDRRKRLSVLLGLVEETTLKPDPSRRFIHQSWEPVTVAEQHGIKVTSVTWRAFDGVSGDACLLTPDGTIMADVVALPDTSVAGAAGEIPPWAFALARGGARVLLVGLVDRGLNSFQLDEREWIHRSAFVLGRTLTGYELLKISTGIDCLLADRGGNQRPLGIIGYGEGGRLALFAGALDERIDCAAVCGSFGPREKLWREPADHNVFGLLRGFGDAEIACLISPRALVVEGGSYPVYGYRGEADLELEITKRPALPGKPGRLATPDAADLESELSRIRSLAPSAPVEFILAKTPVSRETLRSFGKHLGLTIPGTDLIPPRLSQAPHDRVGQLVRHNQELLIESAGARKRYFAELKTDSLATFSASIEPYREKFRTEVIGDFERPLLPARARSRPYQEGPRTISYEIVLDVMESGGATVMAYGILTLPKDLDLTSGERRPVIVCQHGLEGTPADLVGEAGFASYQAFATRLAERGFITFAPQNGYKYFDLFRLQQFKAQSIGGSLFSIIVPQHKQITDWLAGQPWVDADRIAFYGLSYGGKSAMRIPPLVKRYCLSICSGDFNEWVWKNAATDPESLRYSYANKGEYEIFEWNLGGTFNYAEMAALICPRPFMVERGHFDGVAPDEQVAFEFAKVRQLYAAKLGLSDRCEIEWFAGPHTIHGAGTFDFLHQHLNWTKPD
jgi:dienelactone hydrolase